MSNSFPNGISNSSLSELKISIPETNTSIILLDYDQDISFDRRSVVTPTLDGDFPAVEKITRNLRIIKIEGKYNADLSSSTNSFFKSLPNEKQNSENIIQQIQKMENIFNNKNTYLLNIENPVLSTLGITQVVVENGNISPIRGSFTFSYSLTLLEIPTNPNSTVFLQR